MRATAPRATLVSWRSALAIVALSPTAVWWIERLVAIPTSGWFAGATTFGIGGDFATFHAAAALVVTGRGDVIYEPAVFQSILRPELGVYGPFGNPPPLALLLSPLGHLSFETAWFVWSAVAVIGIGVAACLLGSKHPLIFIAWSLLLPPVYYALTFGQLSVLWLVILSGTYQLLKRGHFIAGGAVAGLLVMKPTLAVGLAVWWLVRWRKYRLAVVSALGTALIALGASYVIYPAIWTNYWDSVSAFVSLRDVVETQWAQFSLWSFWDLLIPGARLLTTVLGLISAVALLAIAVWQLRRSESLDGSMIIAVVLTLLVVPHLLAYDWTLLLIPGVLLLESKRDEPALFAAGFIVISAAAWSLVLTNWMLDVGGFAFQMAPLALLGSIWLLGSSGLIPGARMERAPT